MILINEPKEKIKNNIKKYKDEYAHLTKDE